MEFLALLDKLDDLLANGKKRPLSSHLRVDKHEAYAIIDQLRGADELKQAHWIGQNRDEMLSEARRETERILEEARDQTRQLRLEAEDYIDQKLAAFEILLNKTLGTVAKGREQLRSAKTKGDGGLSENGETITANTGPFDAADLRQPAS